MQANVSESGHVVVTRMLTSRVAAPCLTCSEVIPVGTVVQWGAHFGIWHLTCDAPLASEANAVPFPPDCPYCHKPIVDPIPTTAPVDEVWCRACVEQFLSTMARSREAHQRWKESQRVPERRPEPVLNVNLQSDGRDHGF